jgi:high-affinity K+ transport system ATPase subunit B
MKITDISHEIFTELGSPTTLSIPAIAFWIRSSVGTLNNLINSSFEENASHEIEKTIDGVTSEIGRDEVSILKKMYLVHFYDSMIRDSIGAASWNSVIEVSDMNARVRKINKSEIGKTLAQVKKEEQSQLDRLVVHFKSKGGTPLQVAGDDTVKGGGLGDSSALTRSSEED